MTPGSSATAMNANPSPSPNRHPYRLLMALAVGAAIAVIVMLAIGRPASAPTAAATSLANSGENLAPAAHPMMAPATGGGKVDSIDVLVERLQTRLQKEPGDVDGWVLLGRSYHYLQRWDDATAAFKKARELGWQGEAPALDAGHSGAAAMPAMPAADPVFQGVQEAVQQQSAALQSKP